MDNYYSTQNCIGNTQSTFSDTAKIPVLIGVGIVNNYRKCNQEIATKSFGNKSPSLKIHSPYYLLLTALNKDSLGSHYLVRDRQSK